MSTTPQRSGHGHWLPGQSGNPGGSSGRAALEALRSKLRTHTDEAVTALVGLLQDPDPAIRLRAVEVFFDRLAGKPVQSVEAETVSWDMSKMGSLYLQALQAAQPSKEPLDVTPPEKPARSTWD